MAFDGIQLFTTYPDRETAENVAKRNRKWDEDGWQYEVDRFRDDMFVIRVQDQDGIFIGLL